MPILALPRRVATSSRTRLASGAGRTTGEVPASAFQAVAWVGPSLQAAWDYREMSPTVHVQADGQTTVWAGG